MSWPFKSQGFLRNQESYSLTKTRPRFLAVKRQQAARSPKGFARLETLRLVF